ncbi:MAG: hypothetical protein ACRDTM_03885 [Micromonosporaceae bacterium]
MAHTTIKVKTEARDRLAILAKERGCTIGEVVDQLAESTPTHDELTARRAAAAAYVKEHLVSDFGEDDVTAGRQMLRDLAAGRLKMIG